MSKGKNELSVSNNIKHQVKNRINLAGRELEVLQWPNFFSIEPTNNYSNRCFPDRVGSSLQRVQTSGQWSEEERTLHINVLELLAIKLDQREKSESQTLSDKQGSLVLPFENEGNKERTCD